VTAAAAAAFHPVLTASARLAATLVGERDEETRLALLKRIARRLERNDGYPTFLKLLKTIAESNDAGARQALADTLGAALRRDDLPGGQLTSWGGSRLWPAARESGGVMAGQFIGSAPRKTFGPIEYLTAWLCQGTQRTRLGDASYADALARIVEIVNLNRDAKARYPVKLEAQARNELEGVYTQATRQCLADIATRWHANETPQAIASGVLAHRAAAASAAVPRGWVVRDL
jgi:hypothetical protein